MKTTEELSCLCSHFVVLEFLKWFHSNVFTCLCAHKKGQKLNKNERGKISMEISGQILCVTTVVDFRAISAISQFS